MTDIKLSPEQRLAITATLKEYIRTAHSPGWVFGTSYSVCECGWQFNFGLKDKNYVSTPEHQEHLGKELDKFLTEPIIVVYYQAYKILAPYLTSFKLLQDRESHE
jgi:hypothetical protein